MNSPGGVSDVLSKTALAKLETDFAKTSTTEIAKLATKRKRVKSITAIDNIGTEQNPVPLHTTVPSGAKKPRKPRSTKDVTSKPNDWRIPILSCATSGGVVKADEDGPSLILVCSSGPKQLVCHFEYVPPSRIIPSHIFNAMEVYKVVRDKLNTCRSGIFVRAILGDRDECRQVVDLEFESKEGCKRFLWLLSKKLDYSLEIE